MGSKIYEIGFLKIAHFCKPTLFDKRHVKRMGAVAIVFCLSRKRHRNAKLMGMLFADLTLNFEILHSRNCYQSGCRLKKISFFR